MEVKINLEKLVKSLLQYAEDNCEETMLDYLNSALQDQGLEYKYGEIVETPQESEDEKVKKFIIEQLFKIRKTIVYNSNLDRELANAIAWIEKQDEHKPTDMSIKEKAHQIAWETSKHYDPFLSKESWCEMAALDMASWLEKQGQSTFEQCKQEGDRIVENPDGTHFNISQLERVAKVEPKFKVGDFI